jgi:uncharacterized protein
MDMQKQDQLKKIIKDLHSGSSVDNVKKEFSKIIKNVSAEEISEMENSLIIEGFPPEEIQRLCDVHVQAFEKSLKRQKKTSKIPGHPVNTYILENNEVKKIIKKIKPLAKKINKGKINDEILDDFSKEFNELNKIIIHYQRKENQLFPFLEQKKFYGPSKVMWGKHDEIRKQFSAVEDALNKKEWKELHKNSSGLFKAIRNMIFMEEKILFPTSLKKLTESDWAKIKKGEPEIGYAWVKPGNLWDANLAANLEKNKEQADFKQEIKEDEQVKGLLQIDEGSLTLKQINLMLKNLPIDISFIDENDIVRYYSATPDRIFPRSPGVIGRNIQNCHPQKSVHVVNNILDAFRKKEKKEAEFWITLGGRFINIRYYAVFDEKGEYAGTLEVSQDITGIKKLEGEKRLLNW